MTVVSRTEQAARSQVMVKEQITRDTARQVATSNVVTPTEELPEIQVEDNYAASQALAMNGGMSTLNKALIVILGLSGVALVLKYRK